MHAHAQQINRMLWTTSSVSAGTEMTEDAPVNPGGEGGGSDVSVPMHGSGTVDKSQYEISGKVRTLPHRWAEECNLERNITMEGCMVSPDTNV